MSISPDGRREITLKLCLLRQVEKKCVEEEQSGNWEEVEDKEVVDDKEEVDDKEGARVKEEDKVVEEEMDQGDLLGALQIWYFPRSGHGCGCISGPGLELFESGITYMACFVSKTI